MCLLSYTRPVFEMKLGTVRQSKCTWPVFWGEVWDYWDAPNLCLRWDFWNVPMFEMRLLRCTQHLWALIGWLTPIQDNIFGVFAVLFLSWLKLDVLLDSSLSLISNRLCLKCHHVTSIVHYMWLFYRECGAISDALYVRVLPCSGPYQFQEPRHPTSGQIFFRNPN